MDVAEIIVVLNLTMTASEPALVEDIFEQREPQGEYLFHVAANAEAISDVKPGGGSIFKKIFGSKDETVQRVLGNEYHTLHEVSVVYSENKKAIVQDYIAQGNKYINTGNFRSLDKDYNLLDGDLDEAYAQLGESLVYMPIDAGEDFTSYVSFEVGPDEPVQFAFEYWRITEGRTLQIVSICKNTDIKLRDVYQYWEKMVEQYSNMPMNAFTGASEY